MVAQGIGIGGRDVLRGGAGAAQVLVRAVPQVLVMGVAAHSGAPS
jgi:hypothetical protein